MKIVEINNLPNGSHRNINSLDFLPEGWAVVPDDMNCENFPFGEIEVENINGILTVISWIPGTIPEIKLDMQNQITELKTQLSATDYKIIKCSEAQLVGEELPYDIIVLHAERQAIRDQINQLEEEL